MGRLGTEAVSVGGTGVLVGGIGVEVGSTVAVKVGGLVGDGVGVSVGFAANALQDANAMVKIESRIILLMVFMLSLTVLCSG
jgi:hypothetical protein